MYSRWITLTEFKGGKISVNMNKHCVEKYELVEVKDGNDTFTVTALYGPDKSLVYYVLETPQQIKHIVLGMKY